MLSGPEELHSGSKNGLDRVGNMLPWLGQLYPATAVLLRLLGHC